jgi:hypothetical protein
MNIKNQEGFMVIGFAMVMAMIMAGIFYFASGQTENLTDRFAVAHSVSYANEMAIKFGQRARWAYDAARADARNPALNLCGSYGGVNTPVGAFRLCLVADGICVRHPLSSNVRVCVSPNGTDPSLIARHRRFGSPAKYDAVAQLFALTVPSAEAQSRFSPPPPPIGVTTNALTVANNVCIGGDCRARCNINADCLTIKFCPLVSQACTEDQIVWQTIALIR